MPRRRESAPTANAPRGSEGRGTGSPDLKTPLRRISARGGCSARGGLGLHRQQAFALHFLARQFAGAANGLGLFTRALFGGLFLMAAQFHLAENALALHLLLERLQGLIDIIIANENLHACILGSKAPSPRRRLAPRLESRIGKENRTLAERRTVKASDSRKRWACPDRSGRKKSDADLRGAIRSADDKKLKARFPWQGDLIKVWL